MSKLQLGRILTLFLPLMGVLRFLSSVIFYIIIMVTEPSEGGLIYSIKDGISWLFGLLALVALIAFIPGIILRVMGSGEEKNKNSVIQEDGEPSTNIDLSHLSPSQEVQIIKKGSREYTYKISESGELILFVHPFHRWWALICDGFIAALCGLIGLLLVFLYCLATNKDIMLEMEHGNGELLLILTALVIYISYYIYFFVTHATSPGKRHNGIKIYNNDGISQPSKAKLVGRALCSLIFGNIRGLQILGIFSRFSKERKMPWDYLCKTTAVYYRGSMYDRVRNELGKSKNML